MHLLVYCERQLNSCVCWTCFVKLKNSLIALPWSSVTELLLASLIHAKQNYLVNDILGMIDSINRYGNYKIHKNASSQAVIYKLTNPIPACLATLTHMNVTGRSKMAWKAEIPQHDECTLWLTVISCAQQAEWICNHKWCRQLLMIALRWENKVL